VCDDVDPATAAASLADGAMYNTGQSCCSVERIYVQQASFDAFRRRLRQGSAGLQVGDPSHEDSYIGPLTRAQQVKVLQMQVADAVAKGARVLTGGHALDLPGGHWFAPTVLSQREPRHGGDARRKLRPDHRHPGGGRRRRGRAPDERHRLRLTAGVYTRDEARARQVLAQVHAGSVYWNCCDRVSPRLPWSGVKHSGVGLTLSTEGITAFTRPKAWHLRQLRVGVGVDLGEQPFGMNGGRLRENRREASTRATPCGPEIDHDRPLARGEHVGEVLLAQRDRRAGQQRLAAAAAGGLVIEPFAPHAVPGAAMGTGNEHGSTRWTPNARQMRANRPDSMRNFLPAQSPAPTHR
jgi:hypothetical protein